MLHSVICPFTCGCFQFNMSLFISSLIKSSLGNVAAGDLNLNIGFHKEDLMLKDFYGDGSYNLALIFIF